MSVISIAKPRLPDQLTVKFGPVEAIGRAVLMADLAVRKHGIRLSMSSDFEELVHVNRNNRADWYPLTPNFDPRKCVLNASNAFWIKGVDDAGDVVLSHVVRLYPLGRSNLKKEIESLHFFYDEPSAAIEAGVSAEVSAPSAAAMVGRTTFSGGLWIRSDHRGGGLARIIPRLSRTLALTLWYPVHHTCFVSKPMAGKGMGQVYGYMQMDYGVKVANLPDFGPPLFGPVLDFALCSMTTDAVTAEIEEVDRPAVPMLQAKPVERPVAPAAAIA